ncbi:hypothetical protein SynSYN20_00907 [Synechococcus sp. SYN20]|uniref:hypothetical protein n=1 Tax=Synechococcus sp. SYN20 TaxID=1050714 RepID=UPI0016452C53|nr:hypothetical protein [Synechococcus sp. SYN20]QNJ25245.1 hypothetical protein SynSYN20_00907 [Synechococcus sp. SYN20]
MSALACLVVSAFLAYLIAEFRKRRVASKSTKAWREASELVFDRNLRFHIKLEYETGAAPSNAEGYAESRDSLVSHLASNLLMLANRRLEIEPSKSEAEEFVRQHCDLEDDLMEGMWISRFG